MFSYKLSEPYIEYTYVRRRAPGVWTDEALQDPGTHPLSQPGLLYVQSHLDDLQTIGAVRLDVPGAGLRTTAARSAAKDCGYPTVAGNSTYPCRNKVLDGGYCHAHR